MDPSPSSPHLGHRSSLRNDEQPAAVVAADDRLVAPLDLVALHRRERQAARAARSVDERADRDAATARADVFVQREDLRVDRRHQLRALCRETRQLFRDLNRRVVAPLRRVGDLRVEIGHGREQVTVLLLHALATLHHLELFVLEVRLAAAERVQLGLDVRKLFGVRDLTRVQTALLVRDLVVDLLDLGLELRLLARHRIEARLCLGIRDRKHRALLVQLVQLALLGEVGLPLIQAVYPAIDPLEIKERTHRLARDTFHPFGSPLFSGRRAQPSSAASRLRVGLPRATARRYPRNRWRSGSCSSRMTAGCGAPRRSCSPTKATRSSKQKMVRAACACSPNAAPTSRSSTSCSPTSTGSRCAARYESATTCRSSS